VSRTGRTGLSNRHLEGVAILFSAGQGRGGSTGRRTWGHSWGRGGIRPVVAGWSRRMRLAAGRTRDVGRRMSLPPPAHCTNCLVPPGSPAHRPDCMEALMMNRRSRRSRLWGPPVSVDDEPPYRLGAPPGEDPKPCPGTILLPDGCCRSISRRIHSRSDSDSRAPPQGSRSGRETKRPRRSPAGVSSYQHAVSVYWPWRI
jgi:hypothetical protein